MASVFVFRHPLIQHKLTYIRNEKTQTKDFRELINELSTLMAYEITRDMKLQNVEVKTPIETTNSKILASKICVIPILRAGLGMIEGILGLIPSAVVGHIGLYRDHQTLQPVEYYVNLPSDLHERDIIVLDPMLATGGSAIAAINLLKKRGASSIKFMCIIASPEGVEILQQAHPDVDIYVASVDDGLNEQGYIVPGLGDAGDRMFGTM